MNYYYDLPYEIQIHIETFLKVKPHEINKIIEDPPLRYKKMLKSYLPTSEQFQKQSNLKIEQINDFNNENQEINKNLIKFFIKFDIKCIKHLGCRIALKYKLIDTIKDVFNLNNIIDNADHVREYVTNDKKYIITSSPYASYDLDNDPHFKYNFIVYKNPLYRKDCTTFYLIMECYNMS